MNKFYVLKESNTFSETLECIGLADLLKRTINILTKNDIASYVFIEDKHGYFELSIEYKLEQADLMGIPFFDVIPYILVSNENPEEIKFSYIDYPMLKEERDAYYALSSDEQKKKDYSLDPNYDIIRLFAQNANIIGYRSTFNNYRNTKICFGSFLFSIFEYYSSLVSLRECNEKKINAILKKSNVTIKKTNALQSINPDKGKGVNQNKANSITLKGESEVWFRQLVRFNGAWSSMTSKYVEKDQKSYVIVPRNIRVSDIQNIYFRYKPLIRVNSSIKMDIITLNLLSQELISNHINYIDKADFFQINKYISGLQVTYFKKLSQFSSAVTNISFLGIPDFISFENKEEADLWLLILDEHKKRIDRIDEGNSSNIAMLQNYRNFFSLGDFDIFFEFSYDYAEYALSSINEKKYYIEPFIKTNMEVLMKTQKSFSSILRNMGFLAIADAIRNSTIIPVIHNNKKDVIFGLSQKFNISSRSPESLINLVSEFVQKYNETLMIKDYHNEKHRKYVTTEEFSEFCQLFDEGYSSKTLSGMLVAYGYSKEPKKEDNTMEVSNETD
jgi:hypothetical protein